MRRAVCTSGGVLLLVGLGTGLAFHRWPTAPARAADPAPGAIVLELKGYLVPVHQVQVTPDVGGRVIQLNVEEGQHVKRGEVLARLDQGVYEAEYKEALARLDLAKARYDEVRNGPRPEALDEIRVGLETAQAQNRQAQARLRRGDALPKKGVDAAEEDVIAVRDQARLAELEVKKWEARYKRAAAGPRQETVAAARAEVAIAQARCERARVRLQSTTVCAPIDGTVLTRKVEVGSVVRPRGIKLPAAVCEVADLADMEVELWVQERDVGRVSDCQCAKVRLEAYPERRYEGVVSRWLPVADRAKGAVGVRVKVKLPAGELPGKYLRPEMAAVVSLLSKD